MLLRKILPKWVFISLFFLGGCTTQWEPEEESDAFPRKTLNEFPGELGEFKRIYWGDLPEDALDLLKPSERYVAWYSNSKNELVNVIILYWEKEHLAQKGEAWMPPFPDDVFSESGWEVNTRPEIPDVLDVKNLSAMHRIYRKETERKRVLWWTNARGKAAEDQTPSRLKDTAVFSIGVYIQEFEGGKGFHKILESFLADFLNVLAPFGLVP